MSLIRNFPYVLFFDIMFLYLKAKKEK